MQQININGEYNITTTTRKPIEKILNHIIIIDNESISGNVTKEIIFNYPFLIENIKKSIELNSYLINTHPIITTKEITENNLYDAFYSIKCNNQRSVIIKENLLIEEILNLIDSIEKHMEIIQDSKKEIIKIIDILIITENKFHIEDIKEITNKNDSFELKINIFNNNKLQSINTISNNIIENTNNKLIYKIVTNYMNDEYLEGKIKENEFCNCEILKIGNKDCIQGSINLEDKNIINGVMTILLNNHLYENKIEYYKILTKMKKYLTETRKNIKNHLCLIMINNHMMNIKAKIFKNYKEKQNNERIKKLYDHGCPVVGCSRDHQVLGNQIFKNMGYVKEIHKIIKNEEIDVLEDNNDGNDTKLDQEREKDSLEHYMSNISLTNWKDEIENNNCMGILLNISTTYGTKLGHTCKINTIKITNLYYPGLDFIIEKRQIESCNALLPIYINKKHWKVAKKYKEMLLGMSLSYFIILIDMTNIMYTSKENINDRYVKSYISFLRTTAEIAFMNKYSYGIKKYLEKYKKEPKNNNMDNKIILGQCLSTGYIVNGEILNKMKKEIKETGVLEITDTLTNYKKMSETLKKLYRRTGGYNKFIKILDKNNGILPNELLQLIIKEIKEDF